MNFSYSRTIHFADTDGAGVVYFAQIFSICHEAYEASLEAQGINLRDFFGGAAGNSLGNSPSNSTIAVPIVHAEASFRQPMFCGDRIIITVEPQQLSPDSYTINYEIHSDLSKENPESNLETNLESNPKSNPESPPKSQQLIAQAQTKHICINPQLRSRQELPDYLYQWLRNS